MLELLQLLTTFFGERCPSNIAAGALLVEHDTFAVVPTSARNRQKSMNVARDVDTKACYLARFIYAEGSQQIQWRVRRSECIQVGHHAIMPQKRTRVSGGRISKG